MSTPPRIAAIPTTYKGIKFRSKLEAAWAEWFDSKGIEWTFEQEGYQLPSGTWYLPDFWLPKARTFVEVKGIIDASVQKPIELAKSVPIGISVVLAEAPAGNKFTLLSSYGDNNLNVFYDKPNRPLCRGGGHIQDGKLHRCYKPVTFRVADPKWEGTVCKEHLLSCITAATYLTDADEYSITINGLPMVKVVPSILVDLWKIYTKYHLVMRDKSISLPQLDEWVRRFIEKLFTTLSPKTPLTWPPNHPGST